MVLSVNFFHVQLFDMLFSFLMLRNWSDLFAPISENMYDYTFRHHWNFWLLIVINVWINGKKRTFSFLHFISFLVFAFFSSSWKFTIDCVQQFMIGRAQLRKTFSVKSLVHLSFIVKKKVIHTGMPHCYEICRTLFMFGSLPISVQNIIMCSAQTHSGHDQIKLDFACFCIVLFCDRCCCCF